MREEKRTIYRCEYCKKYLLHKSSMLRHESMCKKNPNIMLKCRDCCFWTILDKEDFIKKVDREALKKEGYDEFYLNRYSNEEITISWSFHYCLKYEKKMMPPKAFNGFYGIVFKETENAIKMPTENEGCPDFKHYKIEEKYENRLAEAYRQFGDKIFREGNYKQAFEYYNKATEIGSYNSSMYDACIKAYELLNDFEGAKMIKEKKVIAEKIDMGFDVNNPPF